MPKRIQRKRTKGYRMPEGVVCVGRGTKWGNCFAIGSFVRSISSALPSDCVKVDATLAVALYRAWLLGMVRDGRLDLSELRNKDLACWCKEGQPCHADVLLEFSNKGRRP